MQLEEYGRVGVFKKKQENYDYLGLLQRSVRKHYLREIENELCFLTGKGMSLPFLKIFQVVVGELDLHDSLLAPNHHRRSLCAQQEAAVQISIYMELLTFTLKQHLCAKKKAKHEISLKEYAYILKTVLAAAQLYEEWRLDYLQLELTTDILFLKPNGEIKLLPFRSHYLKEEATCDCFS
jgi:hypothetical protein